MKTFTCPALLLAAITAMPSHAQDVDFGAVRLLDGGRQSDGRYLAALEFDLRDGWKTYWTHPGPFGLPTQIDILMSDNIARLTPDWPEPQLVGEAVGSSVGYYGYLVLPLIIEAKTPDTPPKLALDVTFGACKEVCIPVNQSFPAVTLTDRATLNAFAINDWRAKDIPDAQGTVTCRYTPEDAGAKLALQIPNPQTGTPEHRLHIDPGTGWRVTGLSHQSAPDMITAEVVLENTSGGSFARNALKTYVFDHDGGRVYAGCKAG